ncbi:MAG: pseudouridine synthase [Pseudomonadota bacterium]
MKSSHKKAPAGVSLERALSKLGVASRTQAAVLIGAGRVRVNERIVRDGRQRVDLHRDRIFLDNVLLRPRTKVYLALHKPAGVTTTRSDEQGRATVYDCLGEWGREDTWLAPVGRLDRASQGLLLFTNDTHWAHRLLDPASHVPKTYHVQLDRHLNAAALEAMRQGLDLGAGERTRPAMVRVLRQGEKTQWLEITLEEGLNRQIRRMAEALGADVLQLVRISIGPLTLGELKRGEYRLLTSAEVMALGPRRGKTAS